MTDFEIASLLLALAALMSYLNHRLVRLPTTIGLMAMSLILSGGIIALGVVHPPTLAWATDLLERAAFDATLLEGMLGFLLFAGALHVNLDDLAEQKGFIALLATLGVLVSAAVVGGLVYALSGALGLGLSFGWALLFGALIAPTDPIAVLGILKTLGVPKTLETKIGGESLFNDGVGVVVFLGIAGALGIGHEGDFGAADVALLFALEAGGGALLGLGAGYLVYRLMRTVDDYHLEVLLSLALVAAGYAVCVRLHLSGPIAMVVAGLLIGNTGRRFAMSETTRDRLDDFWELIDEILNAVLFVMIGLELLVLTFEGRWLLAGVLAIPIALFGRFVAVGGAIRILRRFRTFTPRATAILTWGGLKGGISVALALTIPPDRPERGALLAMTYVVVSFSIIVQGLTVAPLVRRALRQA